MVFFAYCIRKKKVKGFQSVFYVLDVLKQHVKLAAEKSFLQKLMNKSS